MITDLPNSILSIFLLTVVLSYFLFVNASASKISTAIVLLIWLALTGILSAKGIFRDTSSIPPKLTILMTPAILVIILLLSTRKGKRFTDALDLRKLTLLHIVRLPVEIVLFQLAAHKVVPELMTFSGRNFDIVSGITAPIVYFTCFKNSQPVHKTFLLVWNFVCLGLLLNIVINALLSAPFPFQQFAFEQPNIAVLYFPFTWLPCFIVVLVLYSHLAAIRQLIKRRK